MFPGLVELADKDLAVGVHRHGVLGGAAAISFVPGTYEVVAPGCPPRAATPSAPNGAKREPEPAVARARASERMEAAPAGVREPAASYAPPSAAEPSGEAWPT